MTNYALSVSSAPWVVAVTGPPGSGKSSTGHELARLLGAALLDQDSMTNPLVDVVADLVGAKDYDDERLAGLVRTRRYDSMLRVAADCVGVGRPVVLVAPFTAERRDPAAWTGLEQQIRAAGGRPRMVWLRVSRMLLAERLGARGASRDAVKLGDVDAYLSRLDLAPPSVPHVEVHGAATSSEQAAAIVRALR